MLQICLFNYLTGNADNHLKNLSLTYSQNWRSVRLAPAYDLVPTTYYARFSRTMGMALGSTRDIDAVTTSDIHDLASQIGVSKRLLSRTASELTERIIPALRTEAKRLGSIGFPEGLYVADNLEEEMTPRLAVLRAV